MNWDPFQREVLAELGLVPYRHAGDSPPVAALTDESLATASDPGDARMLARLAQAAEMTVDALQAHFDGLPAGGGLRGNPAAKRALWPRLRALRKSRT